MKRSRVLFSFFALVVINSIAFAGPFQQEAESALKKAGLKLEDLGVYVGGAEGKPLMDLHGAKVMIPASVTKILTAGAVLHFFPPGTRFKTQLLSDGKIEGTHLKGSLYLKGGGDPSFVSETMWVLVNNFTRSGIKTIDGDLVVDDSLFDKLRFDPSRQSQRVDRAYDAPTGAMSFNWNSVNIYVRPGKKVGEKAEVFLDPENEYLKLANKVKTVAGRKSEVMADRKDDEDGDGDLVSVSGSIGTEANEMVIYKNIYNPDLWSGFNLKAFLNQRGITLKGKIRSGATSENATLLAEVESKPVEQILADMNKFSNNYVAEMLTKQMGSLNSKPGSMAAGMEAIREFLKTLGVSKEEYSIINPSGFTRDNRLSATALWKVLRHIQQQFLFSPEFISSLPIAGVDGTLKKRMRDTEAERAVRAKTGLLNGVVALAGYAGRKDGKVFPFVFLYNGNADESKVRNTVDHILVKLIEAPSL